MSKRKIPPYRDLLGRRFDPWRDRGELLDRKLAILLNNLGVDPGVEGAYQKGFKALITHHGKKQKLTAPTNPREALLRAARDLVPGFQITLGDFTMKSFYAARHPTTRPPAILDRGAIAVLVSEVNKQIGKRKIHASGVKKAINRITDQGGKFAGYKKQRRQLELIYHRNRHKVPPPFPALTLCVHRSDGSSCFTEDPFFDDVPNACRSRGECPFWQAWSKFEQYVLSENQAESLALSRVNSYRRQITK
jgi:hypothetical protein